MKLPELTELGLSEKHYYPHNDLLFEVETS